VAHIERTAEAVWEGNVARGAGAITGGSGAFAGLPYRGATRIGADEGETSPEELIAAAHAGCFAMSLAGVLSGAGTAVERLEVRATCVMDKVDEHHRVVASQLEVRARAAELDQAALDQAVEQADEGCPISALIRPSADVRITATVV
jgi:osmotically inducible protein OsmC